MLYCGMEKRCFSVALLFLCCTLGSTLEPDRDLSIEDSVVDLQQKMTKMEDRLSSLEKRETPDLLQKVNQLLEKVEKMEAETRNARDDISGKFNDLEQRTLRQKEEILRRVSEVQKSCVQSTADVSERLQDAENASLNMDAYLLAEMRKARHKSSDAIAKVRSLEQDFEISLERERSKSDILQVKINGTLERLNSFLATHRNFEAVVRKNISQAAEKLTQMNNSLISGYDDIRANLTAEIRIIENSLLKTGKDHANVSVLSKLNENLQNVEKALKTEFQSFQTELLQRVEQLETCAQCDDVAEINEILRNHSFEISVLNTQLSDIENSCPDPPRIENAYPVIADRRKPDRKHGAIVIYACRDNRTLVGSAEIACYFGEWTGDLPECMNNCNTEDLKNYDVLDVPVNRVVPHSETVNIRCRRGYVPASASESFTCFNGTWSISDDTCTEESCVGEPPVLKNGKAMEFERKHGTNVQYECDQNFVMTGSSTVYCRFGKWEGHEPVCSFFDNTFYVEKRAYASSFACHSNDYVQKIDFSRVLNTGWGENLPDINETIHSEKVEFELSEESTYQSLGVFQCGINDERGSMNIVVQIQNIFGYLYFLDPFKVANIGDTVELEVSFDDDYPIRWRRNGETVPSWDNKKKVEISSVRFSDAGTYECYYAGKRGDTPPALLRLIVRKCRKNLFGEQCDQQCPPCYNGGICHDHLGICVCPAGFTGNHCEIACDYGLVGANCTENCDAYDCQGYLFCKPDPYGCSCALGFEGINCERQCELGWYGADCKQPCHCSEGPEYCSIYTGACSSGCSFGWTGESCQIPVLN